MSLQAGYQDRGSYNWADANQEEILKNRKLGRFAGPGEDFLEIMFFVSFYYLQKVRVKSLENEPSIGC